MKTMFFSIFALFLGAPVVAQDDAVNDLLQDYIQLKDDLVNANSQKAAATASVLLEKVEKNSMAKWGRPVRMIAQTTNLERQREALEDLSPLAWELAKQSKGLNQTVYYQYCPMRKAFWLSSDKAIRNPYYGSQMLTCGTIVETKTK